MPQCRAKSKRSGERCKNNAVTGYRVCRMHGAGSPKAGRPGGRPPTHGRYSMRLPAHLLKTYEQARRDPDLLALRDEVSLLDARLVDVLSKVNTGESGATWGAARAAHRAVQEARKTGDAHSFAAALADLGELIERGLSEYAAWGEVFGLIEQRRRLVESERRRLVEMQQMITAEQALMLATRLAMIVKENVTDPVALANIAREFSTAIRFESRRDAELPA